MTFVVLWSAGAVLLSLLYLWLQRVNASINNPHPSVAPHVEPCPSEADLAKLPPWQEIDDLAGLPDVAHINHVVVGGAGSVGAALCDILARRGASSIRVLDVQALPDEIEALSQVDYIKTDIRNKAAVDRAFSKPFPLASAPVVVHHTASIIRFFERLPYVKHLTFDINVKGLQNVIDALEKLPNEDKSLVYTSSASVHIQSRSLLLGQTPSRVICRPQDDVDSNPQATHYMDSKRAAEKVVVAANGRQGVRTAIIRPGMPIVAPRDLFLAHYLVAHTSISVWADKQATGGRPQPHLVTKPHAMRRQLQRRSPSAHLCGRGPPRASRRHRRTGAPRDWRRQRLHLCDLPALDPVFRATGSGLQTGSTGAAASHLFFGGRLLLWSVPPRAVAGHRSLVTSARYQLLSLIRSDVSYLPTGKWVTDIKFFQPALFYSA
jgi:nucleoside-diphosphate-sugar epimerase